MNKIRYKAVIYYYLTDKPTLVLFGWAAAHTMVDAHEMIVNIVSYHQSTFAFHKVREMNLLLARYKHKSRTI